MKLFLIIMYIAANLYFFLQIKENRYGKALPSRQKALGMAVTFLVITAAFVPALRRGQDIRLLPVGLYDNIFYVLMAMLCGLWLVLTFKPAFYPKIRLLIIRFCLLLVFVLILWPFLFGR